MRTGETSQQSVTAQTLELATVHIFLAVLILYIPTCESIVIAKLISVRSITFFPWFCAMISVVNDEMNYSGRCRFRLNEPTSEICQNHESCKCTGCENEHFPPNEERNAIGWNLLMSNFVAKSNTYPVRLPIPVTVDIYAHSIQNLTLQGFLLTSRTSVPLFKSEAVSQTILIPPAALKKAAAAAGPSGWVVAMFRLVPTLRPCECIAEDCLDLRLTTSAPMAAAAHFGFNARPAEPWNLPRVIHFVHLAMGPSHQRQRAAVRTGRAAAAAAATATSARPARCDSLFLAAVQAVEVLVPDAVVMLHTDKPDEACIQVRHSVHVMRVVAPATVGGRPVLWHQHQADVVCNARAHIYGTTLIIPYESEKAGTMKEILSLDIALYLQMQYSREFLACFCINSFEIRFPRARVRT